MASVDINDLNSEYARRMALLLRDSGLKGLTINSAYRDNDLQARIRAEHEAMPGGVAAHPAAPAGFSYHNYGGASDWSGKDLPKLRAFAAAHPEYGITNAVPNDPGHFQLADSLQALKQSAPALESGVDIDEVRKYLANFGAVPAAPPNGNLAPPPPAAYGGSSVAPPTPTATPLPNFGTTINSPPAAAPAAAPTDAPSVASLIGKGDFKGALAAGGDNSLIKGGMDALSKGMSAKAPDIKPPEMPAIQDNSAAIAQQAPQMMAALMAQIRARQQALQPQDSGGLQIPGLTLNKRRMF